MSPDTHHAILQARSAGAETASATPPGRLQVRPGASACLGTLPAPAGADNHRRFVTRGGIPITIYTMWCKVPGTESLTRCYFAEGCLLPQLRDLREFREGL